MFELNSFRFVVLAAIATVVYFNYDITGSIRSIRAPIVVPAANFSTQIIAPSSGSALNIAQTSQVSWSPYFGGAQTLCLELWTSSNLEYQIQCFASSATTYNWNVPWVLTGGQYSLNVFALMSNGDRFPHATGLVNIVVVQDTTVFQLSSPASSPPAVWNIGSSETLSMFSLDTTYATWSAYVYAVSQGSPLYYGQSLISHKDRTQGITHTFTIPSEWGLGYFYFVVCAEVSFSQQVCLKSARFSIEIPKGGSVTANEKITIQKPVFGQIVHKNETLPIVWSAASQVEGFTIELWNTNTKKYKNPLLTVISRASPDVFSYNWALANYPYPLQTSNSFFVRIWGYGAGSNVKTLVGYSDFFTIREGDETDGSQLESACTSASCQKVTLSAVTGAPTNINGATTTGSGSGGSSGTYVSKSETISVNGFMLIMNTLLVSLF